MLSEFTTGYQPEQVAYSPHGEELWVTPLGSAAGVEAYDVGSGERTHQIDLGRPGAVEIVFTQDGRTAYVSQLQTASVFAIDTRTYRQTRQYDTGGVWTKVMALSPDERTIYASDRESDDVSAVAGRTLLRTGGAMRHLVADPAGRSACSAGRTWRRVRSGARSWCSTPTPASRVTPSSAATRPPPSTCRRTARAWRSATWTRG